MSWLFARPRVAVQAVLGFSSGLPLMLTGATLTAWLTVVGVRTQDLALFGLVSMPYSLKVLWAPFFDRYALAWPWLRLGRRRSVIALSQLLLCGAILALGAQNPVQSPLRLSCLAVLVAFLSASQDIVVDAYRAELLPESEAAAGTAMYVLGYRAAVIVSGGFALYLAEWYQGNFRIVYLLLGLLLLPLFAVTLLMGELPGRAPQRSLGEGPRAASLTAPVLAFFRRDGALVVLLFVLLYRLPDALVNNLTTAFLLKRGYALSEVAEATKIMGLACSIVGALLGGQLVQRVGLRPCLLGFGLLQAVSNVGYVVLDGHGHSRALLHLMVGLDQLSAGLGVAAAGAFMLGQCEQRYSATQTALLTSASGVLGRVLSGVSGFLIERSSWSMFFALSALVGLPALLLIRRLPQSVCEDATSG